MSKPEAKGLLTFFYYKDLKKAAEFYQKIMGFKLVQDPVEGPELGLHEAARHGWQGGAEAHEAGLAPVGSREGVTTHEPPTCRLLTTTRWSRAWW